MMLKWNVAQIIMDQNAPSFVIQVLAVFISNVHQMDDVYAKMVWSGQNCDDPICANGCINGYCVSPGIC
ncbi:hypothetical protein WUBG_15840, partial [Wuchereria bancrofti]